MQRPRGQAGFTSTRCFCAAPAVALRVRLPPSRRFSPLPRRRGAMTYGSTLHAFPHLTSAVRFASECAVPSGVFVRFQPTPNDACYKFYVDGMTFLPPGTHTVMFDSTNSYQSPLARTLLDALPMVQEVTVGTSFVTVRRVEESDARAAARLFVIKWNNEQSEQGVEEAAAAAHSQALQQHVNDVRDETEDEARRAAAEPLHGNRSFHASLDSASSASAPSGAAAEAPIELGGFTVSPSTQDEQIDESAIEALIAATDWSDLKFHVSALLTDHISSGSPHVDPSAPNPHADTVPEEGDAEVVLMIKELVATTIRPQLQDDGGDLRFIGFDADSGEMRVELLGACRTCKSSKTTLVDLIERTTRHWIPEVKAVKDVSRVVSFNQRYAEEAMAEVESSRSVADLLQDMEVQESGGNEFGEKASRTVQFTPSPAKGSSNAGYRVVREVKASAPAADDGKSAVVNAEASSS
ncbi:putative mitochondrial HIRA-interacting protein 5 [Leptomonas pyrrhocoris]|uniref:Putative mitochondrial HIRA-interacting protein 5 n=1 Tax=Leptomonas pyrrhocoris TaxID=157538 RepID=A0A0N1J4I2_LEPPY|nr:putative mitochondrial HIRA-interacting protein 5 [Leptomonas pyrrhocoris]XP_015655197.1 putative mitochondrial HIRA-interacting protein 5 [Leptomonas pyrrhocoris]KPA76757.1 putative mitochondrial HIRA-interacting protein 5 [Leptomonas pyrrhocoris]KPA76758.1 putative mitochondrial HIRA-interacting protein 5 [Leptomonas pyrrhocoris]|eukprot:XP_015655196.1 putative mitochondrial HIRA-interacting protein 5 [Leptomonas pyrrhocoris]